MAVKASATITLTSYRDTQSVTRYYKLQPAGSSAPSKPETKPPSSDWTDSEPACDISKELYFCDLTIFSNGEGEYSKVSKSTSYEAAKQAYNKANDAKDSIDNLEIGGRNLLLDSSFTDVNKWFLSGTDFASNVRLTHSADGGKIEIISTATGSMVNAYRFVNFNNSYEFLSTEFKKYIQGEAWLTLSCDIKINFDTDGLDCLAFDFRTMDSHNQVRRLDIFFPNNMAKNTWIRVKGSVYINKITDKTIGRNLLQIVIRSGAGRTAGSIIEYRNVKLEIGNKATNWTPAPEDVDAGISNAQTAAKEAADLADSKVGISKYYSDKEILDNTIDSINTSIGDINSTTDNLSSAVSKELVFNGFANFTSEPTLTLGKTTSEWKVIIKNDGIFLQKSSNDVASLSKEMSSEETTLRADNARLANVKFRSANGGGKLGIVAQSNGHVSLKEV